MSNYRFGSPHSEASRDTAFVVLLPHSTDVVDVFNARTITDAESLATLMYGAQATALHAAAVGFQRVANALQRLERVNVAEWYAERACERRRMR